MHPRQGHIPHAASGDGTICKRAAQAAVLERLLPRLTPEEIAIYRRGRNTRLNSIPKHATHEQYAKATGLETLFGALYLSGQTERINTLFTGIMEDLNAI